VFLATGYTLCVLFPLILAPLGLRHVRRLGESKTPSELIELLGDTGKLLALYALLLAVGLLPKAAPLLK